MIKARSKRRVLPLIFIVKNSEIDSKTHFSLLQGLKLSNRIRFVPILNWLYVKTNGTLLWLESRSAGCFNASLRDTVEILKDGR